ncbi:hypothetical protein L210DRAFT_3133635 [Boletus edulis BED1]|uniref:Uncharacterized protein n=1 Tax=Boletus edulis BED1 TaxID=1328754 RepID=A0AAD4BFN3_BOLED|nr:hypothetical protein L210DRAFT_3133635 [Boletus edulis BED1]
MGAGNVEARLAWIPQLILNVESTFQSDGTLPIMSSSATLRLWIPCMTHSQFRHSHVLPHAIVQILPPGTLSLADSVRALPLNINLIHLPFSSFQRRARHTNHTNALGMLMGG